MNRVIEHHLKFNGSYHSLEQLSSVVNSTPNTAIQLPDTKYRIKKLMKPIFVTEKHTKCKKCMNYIGNLSERECCEAPQLDSLEYFIYISIGQ